MIGLKEESDLKWKPGDGAYKIPRISIINTFNAFLNSLNLSDRKGLLLQHSFGNFLSAADVYLIRRPKLWHKEYCIGLWVTAKYGRINYVVSTKSALFNWYLIDQIPGKFFVYLFIFF